MSDEENKALLQPVDPNVRKLARTLVRSSRFGALSVLRPSDGFPSASRVLCASDFNGRPVILISFLSLHARALAVDPRCSLMLGEPGKGDPLAYPRLTIFARGRFVGAGGDESQTLRHRFLARHPKAELYIDFPDFRFVVLDPDTASLNGGFAKASELSSQDMLDERAAGLEIAAKRAVDHMNEDHADAIDSIAARHGKAETGWRIATADRRGFEIARSDHLRRIEFGFDPVHDGGYRKAFVDLLKNKDGR